MLDSRDERKITANIAEVLTKLRANYTNHQAEVVAATEGRKTQALRLAQDLVRTIKSGKPFKTHFDLPEIEDHSKEYLAIITMLELHQNSGASTIELKAADVQKYVLNQWDWMDRFRAVAGTYTARAPF